MVKEIAVKLAPTKNPAGNIVGAIADVEFQLGEQGSMTICGYRVMVPDGKPPWVSPPRAPGQEQLVRRRHAAWANQTPRRDSRSPGVRAG